MRTFISILLIISVVLLPSLVLAEAPPPVTTESHPDAIPPTKAPTKPLPPASLPGETPIAPETQPAATSGLALPPVESISPLAVFMGGTIVTIVLFGWYIWRRGNIRGILRS